MNEEILARPFQVGTSVGRGRRAARIPIGKFGPEISAHIRLVIFLLSPCLGGCRVAVSAFAVTRYSYPSLHFILSIPVDRVFCGEPSRPRIGAGGSTEHAK